MKKLSVFIGTVSKPGIKSTTSRTVSEDISITWNTEWDQTHGLCMIGKIVKLNKSSER